MTVLVTGGAGFIGSHLVARLLEEGAEVRVLDSLEAQVHGERYKETANGDAELVRADIRDRDAVGSSLEGVDRVVHLAAAIGVGQSIYEIERYTSVNALGTAILLDEMSSVRDRLQKVVVASSMSIYGEGQYRCPVEERDVAPGPRSDDQLAAQQWEVRCPSCGASLEPVPTSEAKPLAPTSIYAIGKRDHEEMFLTWGRAYKVPATALRFFNVYGPGQSLSNPYTGVAAIFASRLLNARPAVIFEDGGQSRDFVHVSDVVSAVREALEPGRGDGDALNVGTGTRTTVLDVAETLAAELGVDIEPDIRNGSRAGDVRHCFADVTRAGELLDYEPSVTFSDGMRDLAAWLAGQEATDLVDEATAALLKRGLTA